MTIKEAVTAALAEWTTDAYANGRYPDFSEMRDLVDQLVDEAFLEAQDEDEAAQ